MSKAFELHSTANPTRQNSPDGSDERLHERIQQRAYQLYEARGAEPGHELEDWTKAEAEILGPMNVSRAA